jgi:hypothetical protein
MIAEYAKAFTSAFLKKQKYADLKKTIKADLATIKTDSKTLAKYIPSLEKFLSILTTEYQDYNNEEIIQLIEKYKNTHSDDSEVSLYAILTQAPIQPIEHKGRYEKATGNPELQIDNITNAIKNILRKRVKISYPWDCDQTKGRR